MYKYEFDAETGGLLLTDTEERMSKEPRPVYATEMNILGFDSRWHYDNQDDVPYLWAEAGNYFYRAKKIAVVRGGSLYEKPTLEFVEEDGLAEGETLLPVDLQKMSDKNRELMENLRQSTIKRIYNYWRRHQRLDCFHVAFSGGKDSVVLLDLVKHALPKSSFIVVFGDTRMEFPDTYKIIDAVEKQCTAEGIAFYRAASKLLPEESWKIFGAPSRKLRWCCGVHKAAPQTLKIREILNKPNYVGAAFVGVRAQESSSRAEYDIENLGEKLRGQYAQHSILEWGSAEIWLYIFMHNLPINETYKKGNSRAGCIFCPLASTKNNFFKMQVYTTEIEKYVSITYSALNPNNVDDLYIRSGAWIARKSGRDLLNPITNYSEEISGGYLRITVSNPKTDWHEWIKTIGEPAFPYEVDESTDKTVVAKVHAIYDKTPAMKIFKSVFHKAAACIGCGVCESNCRQGAISFKDGFHIDENKCVHCLQCHDIENGCHLYDSTRLMKEGSGNELRGLNVFNTHAPKLEWIKFFFDKGNDFFSLNKMGDPQVKSFKQFLIGSRLIGGKSLNVTETFHIIKKIGWNTATAWGILFINLTYDNKQIRWYVDNMPIGQTFSARELKDKLISMEISVVNATHITTAFRRLCEIPLGTELNFGTTTSDGKNLSTLKRTKAKVDDGRVVLYALYKFAEATDGWYQFNLSRLMSDTDSAGVSPAKIFGIERNELAQFLNGLSANYPDFINATFTHDLEKISLSPEKASQDVLKLF